MITRLLPLAGAAAVLLVAACGSTPGAGGPDASQSSQAAATSPPAALTSAPAAVTSAPGAVTPAPSGPALATGAARRRAAARYLAIAEPANRRLDHDLDDGLEGDDRDDLAASRTDLRDAAATERRFDRQMLALPLAPATEAVARILVTANQSRARLTDRAARVTSLALLRVFERRLDAANVPVEDAVKIIRSQLGLPPPESS